MLDQSAQILNMLAELRAEMRAVKRDKELWTLDDIADFLSLSKKTVQNHVVRNPGFPLPSEIPSSADGHSRTKRWEPEEVRRWARMFRPNPALRRVR